MYYWKPLFVHYCPNLENLNCEKSNHFPLQFNLQYVAEILLGLFVLTVEMAVDKGNKKWKWGEGL